MDRYMVDVGERIRSRVPHGMTQRELARRVKMTPDALSRALNGQRGFSLSELAGVAETLGADAHWLLTGQDDPHRMDFAARHDWDPALKRRSNPGLDSDKAILQRVTDVYRDAYPDGAPATAPLQSEAAGVRGRLGDGFVRRFAEMTEVKLGVDVVRVNDLSTDYSLTIGERGVILLRAVPAWFRSNWSLAHELGHLALGHHDGYASTTKHKEAAADKFAAELLLPRSDMLGIDWQAMDSADVAGFLWTAGVSTAALRTRLSFLKPPTSEAVGEALTQPTPTLIRKFGPDLVDDLDGRAQVAEREQQASARRFPLHLVSALTQRVEAGLVSPESLAWLLDVPVDDLDFPDANDDETAAAERYASGVTPPSDADLAAWFEGRST